MIQACHITPVMIGNGWPGFDSVVLILNCNTFSGCKTYAGKKCVFPFKDDGKVFNSCTLDRYSKYWCSTNNKAGISMGEWGTCDMRTCGKGKSFKCNKIILWGQLVGDNWKSMIGKYKTQLVMISDH